MLSTDFSHFLTHDIENILKKEPRSVFSPSGQKFTFRYTVYKIVFARTVDRYNDGQLFKSSLRCEQILELTKFNLRTFKAETAIRPHTNGIDHGDVGRENTLYIRLHCDTITGHDTASLIFLITDNSAVNSRWEA